jgi:hypothetical protein
MPAVDLETLTDVNTPSALDPFGLLSERERELLRQMLANDDSLPEPGSVLPLSWNPIAPTPIPTPTSPRPRPRNTTTIPARDVFRLRCANCNRPPSVHPSTHVVGRNHGTYLDNYLPVGSVLCDECTNRRRRFTNRYTFYRIPAVCENGGGGLQQPVAFIQNQARNAADTNPTWNGMFVCETCINALTSRGHVLRRF